MDEYIKEGMLGLALRALHISNALPFLCSRHTAFPIFTTCHNTMFFVRDSALVILGRTEQRNTERETKREGLF